MPARFHVARSEAHPTPQAGKLSVGGWSVEALFLDDVTFED